MFLASLGTVERKITSPKECNLIKLIIIASTITPFSLSISSLPISLTKFIVNVLGVTGDPFKVNVGARPVPKRKNFFGVDQSRRRSPTRPRLIHSKEIFPLRDGSGSYVYFERIPCDAEDINNEFC